MSFNAICVNFQIYSSADCYILFLMNKLMVLKSKMADILAILYNMIFSKILVFKQYHYYF